MLLSLLVYSVTGATLFFLGWHVNKREQQSLLNGGGKLPFYSWEILLSLVVFSVIAGARYHTGFDHAMYLEQYQHLQETGDFSRHNFEYGFEWISRLFAWCNIHYFFYFAFWALLQIAFLYFGLRNHKHLLCWVGLGIMCGSYFLWMMNSVRQAVVVCLFVALVSFFSQFKDRSSHKNIFVLLFILSIVMMAAFIHKSALMLIAIFLFLFLIELLSKTKISVGVPSKWIMLSVFAVFVLLGAFPYWIDIFSNYQWFLDLTGYSNYGNLDDPNVGGQFKGFVPWGPSRLSSLIGSIAMILLYPQLRAHFKSDRQLPYFFLLAYIGMCVYFLLINTTHFILRPTDYFTIFYLIMSAYVMCYLIQTRKYVIGAGMALVFYSIFIINVYKAVYRPIVENQPFLYHFFFAPSL